MVSEWMGAVVVAAALLLVFSRYLGNRRNCRREAELVSIDARPDPSSDKLKVTVHNGGTSPIWNCVVSASTAEGEILKDVWDVVMPGPREVRVPLPSTAQVMLSVEFTDGSEYRWRRNAQGSVTSLGRALYRRDFFSCAGG
jgi:hypothetical protein